MNQRRWRIVGGITLGACALMAVLGPRVDPRESVALFFAYWLVFLVLLIVSLYLAFVDFRYIRLQARAEERRIFLETLGNEEFRKQIRDAQEKAHRDKTGKK